MTDLLAQVAGTVLAGLVIWKVEPALVKMRKGTPILLRFSLWLLVVGSFARLVWIFLGNVPDPVTLLMLGGAAALTSSIQSAITFPFSGSPPPRQHANPPLVQQHRCHPA